VLRVLGIDPGLATTGYGIVDGSGSRLEPVEYGVIRSGKGELAERISVIHRQVLEIIIEFSPDAVSIEQVFKGPNVQSLIKLAHARSVAMLAAGLQQIPVFEYTPRQIKKALTGRGGAEKEQVAQMVGRLLRLGEAPKPLDASDALAIAICHLNSPAARLGQD
jgi:crossover junction endodeoxyribonuclease RuvC